jgi:putative endonuclease
MSSRTHTLYIGVTNDLIRRIDEHRSGEFAGFTAKYKVNRLVYFEQYDDIGAAIAREKQLKNWRREKKIALVRSTNPGWTDLSLDLLRGG